MRKLLLLSLLLPVGCGILRPLQNPDAKLVRLYSEIQGAADTAKYLLDTKAIDAETAQVLHDVLAIAKAHADEEKAVLLKAKAEGRTASREEVAQAWSLQDLAVQSLERALALIASHEKKGAPK